MIFGELMSVYRVAKRTAALCVAAERFISLRSRSPIEKPIPVVAEGFPRYVKSRVRKETRDWIGNSLESTRGKDKKRMKKRRKKKGRVIKTEVVLLRLRNVVVVARQSRLSNLTVAR